MNALSVLINTYNEEHNIRNCLESVSWADEIVIVDMYSTDNTVAIAKEFSNVKVFYFENCGYADPAREFAFNQSTHDWVLVLDADEMIPKSLCTQIGAIINEGKFDAISIPRKNYMFGEEILCGDWGTESILRVMRKESVIGFNQAIHSQFYLLKPDAKITYLLRESSYIIHFNYSNLEHFLAKSNRYTTIDAENAFNKLKKPLSKFKLILAAFIFIPKFMLQQKGYKNKFIGLTLAVLMLNYHFSRYLKYKLMQKYSTTATKQAIIHEYDMIARKIISEYEHRNT